MSRRSWGIMEGFYVKHGVVSEAHEFSLTAKACSSTFVELFETSSRVLLMRGGQGSG
jgi:hypothetical protein